MKRTSNSPEDSNPEIRAFIYQQLSDLEGLMPQGSNVSIVVEDPAMLKKAKKIGSSKKLLKKTPPSKKKVVIQLETAEGNLLVESEHSDVYVAIQAAKENLRGQLFALQSFLNPDDRDKQISDIIEHRILH
jgi:ribosome-associated translation inhibitor RaiA